MKTPLHYQLSEYDCGPTSLMNAISFLFEREEIPPEVLRNIMLYSLDCYSPEGTPGKHGTSRTAMMFLAHWLDGFGKAGQLIRLNCKTLEYKYFPFDPKGYKLVLIDSCVKHELASSAYNKRRASCENAAAAIRRNHPEVECLSDAKRVWLDEVRAEIPEEDFLRAEYVIGEVQRVLDVCDALERGDYETVGEMMYQTHFGLSRLYEVSCEELDFLNKLARKMDVTGSRVMGGGFGGCTINLVKDELYDEFVATAVARFTEKFGHAPKVYDVVISDGARRLE